MHAAENLPHKNQGCVLNHELHSKLEPMYATLPALQGLCLFAKIIVTKKMLIVNVFWAKSGGYLAIPYQCC